MDRSDESPELKMTSMIDIVFLLLIFFTVSLKFRSNEGRLESHLPKDQGIKLAQPDVDLKTVRIRLRWKQGSDGPSCHLHVARRSVSFTYYPGDRGRPSPDFSEVRERLLELKRTGGEKLPIRIDARPDVPYKFVVRAVNACIEAGLRDVTFARTEHEIR